MGWEVTTGMDVFGGSKDMLKICFASLFLHHFFRRSSLFDGENQDVKTFSVLNLNRLERPTCKAPSRVSVHPSLE